MMNKQLRLALVVALAVAALAVACSQPSGGVTSTPSNDSSLLG